MAASYIRLALSNGQTLNFEIDNAASTPPRFTDPLIERAQKALQVLAVARVNGALIPKETVVFRDSDITSLSYSAPNLIVGGVNVEVDSNSVLEVSGIARGPLINGAAGSIVSGASTRKVKWGDVSTVSLVAVSDGGLAGQQNPS